MENVKEKFRSELEEYIKKNYIAPRKTGLHRRNASERESIVFSFRKMPPEECRRAPEEKPLEAPHYDETHAFTASCLSEEFVLEPTFQERLFHLIDERNLKDSEVYKASCVDKRLFSKIRSDKNYSPSKNTVIQLCFGLQLEIDTALDLLSSAGYALSTSVLSDVIVRFYLEKKDYNLMDLNTALYDHDLKPVFE